MSHERFATAAAAILFGLAVGCGSITGTSPDGGGGAGGGGAGGGGAGGGGSGGTAGHDAAADGKADAAKDGPPPGFCNTADDCAPQYLEVCCGFCVAIADPPLSASICPTGQVICGAVPGGCSCVNHQCVDGILAEAAACDPQHDQCGLNDKCCRACGTAPIDGGQTCPATCVRATPLNGKPTCPLVP